MPKEQKLSLINSMTASANVFTKAANKNSERLVGAPQFDAGLSTYLKLKKEDLDDLSREFGLDAVGQYVRSMEAKRMRRK
jgi:hypothetical protein